MHGDTQAQSTPAFALAHLLGIDLMPRIRNIKDLVFFKPGRNARYQAIQPLFSGGAIDWDLIARHYKDMLRVAEVIRRKETLDAELAARATDLQILDGELRVVRTERDLLKEQLGRFERKLFDAKSEAAASVQHKNGHTARLSRHYDGRSDLLSSSARGLCPRTPEHR